MGSIQISVIADDTACSVEGIPTLDDLWSAGKFPKIFQQSNIGFLILDAQLHVVDADQTVLNLIGYDIDEIKGSQISGVCQKSGTDEFGNLCDECVIPGDMCSREITLLNKSGNAVYASIRLEAYGDNSGELESGIRYFLAVLEDITDAREKEQSLVRVKQQLNVIADRTPALISYLDEKLSFQFVNQSLLEFFGLNRGQILGRPIQDLLGQERWAFVNRYFGQALAGEQVSFECLLESSAGEYTNIFVRLVPEIEHDEVIGLYFLGTDVSEIKEAENQLLEANKELSSSHENLMSILESTPDSVFVVNNNGDIIFVNSNIEEMFGYKQDELLGQNIDVLVPEVLREAHRKHRYDYAHSAIPRQIGQQIDLMAEHKDGHFVSVEIYISPIKYDGGTAILANVRNVTETKKALQESRELAGIVEASGDAIIKSSVDGKIEYWSKGAENLYGFTAEEAKGQFVKTLLSKDNAIEENTIELNKEKILRGELVSDPDAVRYDKEGNKVQVSLSIFPIINTKGEVVASASVHRDIGEFKALEAQLRHSQRLEAAGELAGGIAHDFNNILTVIQGYCSLVAEELPIDSDLKVSMNAIQRATERAGSLTKQLLAFSRKQRIDPKILNPRQQINEFTEMLQRTLRSDINMETDLQSSWLIKEDPAQLEQIVLNLSLNARQAMSGGGMLNIMTKDVTISDKGLPAVPGKLTYSPEKIKPGEYVLIEVSDSGTGIDEKTLIRIFEPFYTTKSVGEGTGLGLSVVYGLVSQVGGGIRVITEKEVGTAFQIYLPRVSGDIYEEISEADKKQGHNETILIVEDDKAVRELTTAMLKSAGYQVRSFAEPRLLLDEVDFDDESTYDLVLSDVVMPGISGPQFAEQWLEKHPSARFLFMSGYADEAILPYDGSMKNLIQKPFKQEELLKRVDELIKQG